MKKILIVDDEPVMRQLVRMSLELDQEYELSEAEDGTQALAKARELIPDLIILDLMMPDMWGYTVCEVLKQAPLTKDVPILILTGRGSAPSKTMGKIKGGDEYMVKPFKPQELREKVKKLLEQG